MRSEPVIANLSFESRVGLVNMIFSFLQGLVSLLQGLVPFLQVIFAGVLGCLTFQIARQQKETNRNQFRLNLFEKRFAVYEAAMEFVALAAKNHTVTQAERIDFLRKTKAARFLFNREADDYFTHLNAEAIKLQVIHQIEYNLGSVQGVEDTAHNRLERIT